MKISKTCMVGFGAVLMASVSALSYATTTYTYNGPAFRGGTDHLSVSFTTSAPLAASKSYLTQAAAGVTAGSVSVVGPNGPLTNFTLPITTFQVHTDANGAIDSWFIFGEFKTLAGTAPTMTGTDWQAYTMNTLAFIPGSDIPGAVGLVTGHYDYDQATETTFYASCTGAPAGCTLAGNGQPYVGNYSGIINPSNTSGAWWTATTDTTNPPPPPSVTIAVSGTLPNGQVNTAYSATLTATGGTAPYTWSATGLPTGLALGTDGVISGTPTTSGTFNNVVVTATDNNGAVGQASYTMTIDPQALSCTKPAGAKSSAGTRTVTAVGANYVMAGATRIDYANCTSISYGGEATVPAVGDTLEWEGYVETNGNVMGQVLTFN